MFAAYRRSLDRVRQLMLTEPWSPHLAAGLAAHFQICGALGITDLATELEPSEYADLMDFVWEDLATRIGPEGQSAAVVLLEDPAVGLGFDERRYLEALANSSAGLYDVLRVQPGGQLTVQDALHGGRPIRVRCPVEFETWVEVGSQLATRLLGRGRDTLVSCGVLDFDPFTEPEGLNRASGDLAPALSGAWLRWLWQETDEPGTEGGLEVTWPLLVGTAEEVVAIFDKTPELTREDSEGPGWEWIDPQSQVCAGCGEAHPVRLGWLYLDGEYIRFEAPDSRLAERVVPWLESLVGERIGDPCVDILESPVVAAFQADVAARLGQLLDLPRDVSWEALVADFSPYESRLRELIDLPQPRFGGISPNVAAQTKRGRQKVVRWLHQLEETFADLAFAGAAPQETGWLWEAVGLVPDRQKPGR